MDVIHSNGRNLGTLALAATMLAATALADTATYSGNSGADIGFYGATWSPATLNPATIDPDDNGTNVSNHDYVVEGGKEITLKSAEVVKARSFTLGVVGGKTGKWFGYYSATFLNEGIFFANGAVRRRYDGLGTIGGKATITSPASAPFVFTLSNYRTGGYKFTGDFSGAADTGFRVALCDNCNYSLTIAFSGDASKFLGRAVVDGETSATGAERATLRLDDTDFGGSVLVKTNGIFGVSAGTGSSVRSLEFEPGAALSLAGPLTVGDLTLADGMSLPFSVSIDAGTCANFIAVTNSLAYGGDGRIVLDVGSAASVSSYRSSLVSIPLFSLPSDSPLDEDDFTFGLEPGRIALQAQLVMSVDDVTGVKTFSLVYYPRVSMQWPADAATYTEDASSAMTNAAQWTDGEIVHAGAHYTVSRLTNPATGKQGTSYIRTPYAPEGSFAFLGESLTLGYACHIYLMSRVFEIPQFVAASTEGRENCVYCSYDSDVTFKGDIYITSGAKLVVQTVNDRLFTHDGNLLGSGPLEIRGRGRSSNDTRGNFLIKGTNTAYTGKVKVTLSKDSTGAYPRFVGRRWTTLFVDDARNLGGPLAAFAYDAFTLENLSELVVGHDVAFTDQTRGLFLNWLSQLNVSNATTTLTLNQPVTVTGDVYKTGAGTLAAGGTLRFYSAEGEILDAPAAGATNVLHVNEGTIRPLAARAFNGLDLVFAGGGLALDAAATDADLAAYGLVNLKSAAPLALATRTESVPVSFVNLPSNPTEAFSVAVCTVPSASAADALAALSVETRVFLGEQRMKVKLAAGAPFTLDGVEAVTIRADFALPEGMMLILR